LLGQRALHQAHRDAAGVLGHFRLSGVYELSSQLTGIWSISSS